MSHGYAGEGQSYFLGWSLSEVPADFSFLRELSDESGTPAIVNQLGLDLACRVGDHLREHPEERLRLVRELREAYWWVRNRRWSDAKPEKIAAFERTILENVSLLELGGVAPRDIVMMAQCMQSRCVCDGCDVYDGQRFCEQR